MINVSELIPLIPELFICVSVFALLMLGAFKGNRATVSITYISCLVLACAIYIITRQPADSVTVFNGLFYSNGFTIYAKILILLGALLPLTLSIDFLSDEKKQRYEYPVLVLLAVLGLMLMVSANDLMSLYMGLELSSLSLYILAAFDRDDSKSSEAGLKYFVLGALASGMILFGASLVYGFSGTTNFETLAQLFGAYVDQPVSQGVIIGMVFIIVGLCFKISAVPFHMWTPDVYEGAPTPVVTFFAVAPKMAAILLMVRFLMSPFELMFDHWQQVVIAASIASMVVGAFGALRQTNIKRLLAYSSIGHVGYALIGLASGSEEGVQAMLIYLTLYLFMSVGAFGFVMTMKRNGKPVETIAELGGLSKNCQYGALFMAIVMFSMAGIPPLAGFFGKFYIFLNAIQYGLYPLVIVGLLSSVVAAYYYIKIVKVMYFDEVKDPFDKDVSANIRYVLALCGLVTLFFFLLPTPLVTITSQAAKALIL